MQQRTVMTLGGAAVVVAGLAVWMVGNQDKPATEITAEGPLYPDLVRAVDDVAKIEVMEGGKTVSISRKAGVWGVDAKQGYPASLDLVKTTVVGLAEARILEPRTNQPELYARIGVEDPGLAGAASRQVTLQDEGGKTLAALIVGKENFQTAAVRGTVNYVRRAGETQSWMVRSPMERLTADPIRWIDRTLPKLERDRIMAVEIKQGDGATVLMKRDQPTTADYALTGLPEGAAVKKSVVTEVTGAVNLFSIDDVAKLDVAKFAGGTTAVYRSFDGVVLTIRQVKDGDSRWLAFDSAFDADAAKPFADSKAAGLLSPADAEAKVKEWQGKYAAWAYKVSDAMGDSFARKADDFVQKDEPKPAP